MTNSSYTVIATAMHTKNSPVSLGEGETGLFFTYRVILQ